MAPKPIVLPEGAERRILPFTGTELRIVDKDGKKILEGLTAPFGKRSLDLGGFVEEIDPGAFTKALKRSDAAALFNHNPDNLLGRMSAKTLRLKETDDGLQYEVDLPNTEIARVVEQGVSRRDIKGNSFSFRLAFDADGRPRHRWDELEDGTPLRTILEIEELFDVGPVVYPAYPDTDVALRSLDQARKAGMLGEDRERLQRLAEAELT